MGGDMEVVEGALALMWLYTENGDFVEGLRKLARKHGRALRELLQTARTLSSSWQEEQVDALLKAGINPYPFLADYLVSVAPFLLGIPGLVQYQTELREYRQAWSLIGRDEERDCGWQCLTHLALLELLGLRTWEVRNEEEAAILLGMQKNVQMKASPLSVARRGARDTARELTSQVREGFQRPRPRREDSMVWLYQRLAERRMPTEIAEAYGESETVVSRLIRRDAKLLGLHLPRGWPLGHGKGPTGRMRRR